jgi:F420H(2)-dependent quinone reductase
MSASTAANAGAGGGDGLVRGSSDRVSPVGYLSDGGRYVVVASNGGAPNQSRLVPQRHGAP